MMTFKQLYSTLTENININSNIQITDRHILAQLKKYTTRSSKPSVKFPHEFSHAFSVIYSQYRHSQIFAYNVCIKYLTEPQSLTTQFALCLADTPLNCTAAPVVQQININIFYSYSANFFLIKN